MHDSHDSPGNDHDMSSARDVIQRSARQLRQPDARYASPALIFKASPTTVDAALELAALKQFDALLLGNAYSDATYVGILGQLQGYLTALPELRGVPLGEVRSAQVMRAELSA
jgi:hypothetical protein